MKEIGICEIEGCGKEATLWRCDEHYRCDECGSKDSLCTYSRHGVLCKSCHTEEVNQRIKAFDGDTQYTDEITCPYCGYEFSDSWEMGESGEIECHDCEHTFSMSSDVKVTYCTEKME